MSLVLDVVTAVSAATVSLSLSLLIRLELQSDATNDESAVNVAFLVSLSLWFVIFVGRRDDAAVQRGTYHVTQSTDLAVLGSWVVPLWKFGDGFSLVCLSF